MDACTENYECLVLDNTSKSNKIQDCVFWYKAKIRKNFKIGSPALWAHHKRFYNPKHDGTQQVYKKKTQSRQTGITVTKKK